MMVSPLRIQRHGWALCLPTVQWKRDELAVLCVLDVSRYGFMIFWLLCLLLPSIFVSNLRNT